MPRRRGEVSEGASSTVGSRSDERFVRGKSEPCSDVREDVVGPAFEKEVEARRLGVEVPVDGAVMGGEDGVVGGGYGPGGVLDAVELPMISD